MSCAKASNFTWAFVWIGVLSQGCVLSSASNSEDQLRRKAAAEQAAKNGSQEGSGNEQSTGEVIATEGSTPVIAGQSEQAPTQVPAEHDPTPTTPTVDGQNLPWAPAPLISGVNVVANRDSVKVIIPPVTNAVDYRIIELKTGVTVSVDASERETVNGTTIHCAGYRQRNVYVAQRELLSTVEVTNVIKRGKYVIEAIDRTCPFVGIHGNEHHELERTGHGIPESDDGIFTVFTEQEIVAKYGSMYINGQGVGAQRGMQAPLNPPKVLARTTVYLEPISATNVTPTTTFFDDFEAGDQPRLLEKGTYHTNHEGSDYYQNDKWTFHSSMLDLMQYFVDRGQLHGVIADGGTENFSSMVAYPRKIAAMSADDYLHVTYEVNTHITNRRYWWISMCGSDTAGQTLKADGTPNFFQRPTSSLQIADGNNPTSTGLNCIMVFPKNGNRYFPLPPDNTPPETDVRVLLYGSGQGVTGHNVDPDIYHYDWMGPNTNTWYRQLDANQKPVGPMLDLLNQNAPRVRFDLFVKRGRVVVFANHEQKLCNDFPAQLVTQQETAVGFGQVLYHTSAEHNDVAPITTNGPPLMRHTYENMPFHDRRDWDNLGFQDHDSLPSDAFNFDETLCYTHTGR